MTISRREFLYGAAGACLSSAFVAAYIAKMRGIILFPRKILLVSPKDGTLFLSHLDGTSAWRSETGLKAGHGFMRLADGTVAVIEKRGYKVLRFDPRQKRIIASASSSDGRYFYGHGGYSRKQNLVFTTEAPDVTNRVKGVVVVRDPESLKVVGEFSSHGFDAHDMVVMEEEGLLAVHNFRDLSHQRSNLVFLDLATGKLVKEIKVPHESIDIRHITYLDRGRILASARRQDFRKPNAPLSLAQEPLLFDLEKGCLPFRGGAQDKRLIDGFNVCVNQALEVVAISHEGTRSIAFYKLNSMQLLSVIQTKDEYPQSITAIDGGGFLIGFHDGNFFQTENKEFRSLRQSFLGSIPSEHALLLG